MVANIIRHVDEQILDKYQKIFDGLYKKFGYTNFFIASIFIFAWAFIILIDIIMIAFLRDDIFEYFSIGEILITIFLVCIVCYFGVLYSLNIEKDFKNNVYGNFENPSRERLFLLRIFVTVISLVHIVYFFAIFVVYNVVFYESVDRPFVAGFVIFSVIFLCFLVMSFFYAVACTPDHAD